MSIALKDNFVNHVHQKNLRWNDISHWNKEFVWTIDDYRPYHGCLSGYLGFYSPFAVGNRYTSESKCGIDIRDLYYLGM